MPDNNPTGQNQHAKRADQHLAQHVADTQPTAMSDSPGSIPPTDRAPAKRGFAAMDEATQRTIASKGGQSQGKGNNPGNFANNRDRAREAGRKGGEAHGHRSAVSLD